MSRSNVDVKLEGLKALLRRLGSVLVAYSGGVDSSFLLKVACEVLGSQVLAVTALSETYPKSEVALAQQFAKKLKVKHKIIRTKEFLDPNFLKNPQNRCYFCKKELFSRLNRLVKQNNINFVIDGSNLDDLGDYRPGSLAKKELKVRSPLQEVGLTKEDIRKLSKKIGLTTWNKPALACLASRIPYNSPITKIRLRRIGRAEDSLRSKFCIKGNLRVRDFGSSALIEVDKVEIGKLSLGKIKKIFKSLGYKDTEIDPKGYRMGRMNEALRKHSSRV